MNPAFEKHAAYMAQAWRTLQDSVLLKNWASERNKSQYVGPNRGAIECDTPDCTNPATPTTVKWSAEGHRYCTDCFARTMQGRRIIHQNIARIGADSPSAADDRHCQNEGCFAYSASDSPYCAPCKQYREDTNLV